MQSFAFIVLYSINAAWINNVCLLKRKWSVIRKFKIYRSVWDNDSSLNCRDHKEQLCRTSLFMKTFVWRFELLNCNISIITIFFTTEIFFTTSDVLQKLFLIISRIQLAIASMSYLHSGGKFSFILKMQSTMKNLLKKVSPLSGMGNWIKSLMRTGSLLRGFI